MRLPSRPQPEGFTLGQVLSVLVVALVVVLGIGMLLPAFPNIRTAANRMSCQNNLKQIGLALLNYNSTYGAGFPAGTVSHSSLPPEERLSWTVEILPYLEQEALYKTLDRQLGWEANGARVQARLKVFRCPGWEEDQPRVNVVGAPYVGAAGIGPDAPLLPDKHPQAGIFGYDRRTTLEQITDGTANTVLILESARSNGPWAQGGPATLRGLDTNDQPYTGPNQQFGGAHFGNRRFFMRGPYIDGHLAFADGSVRGIRQEASPRVLEALMTIAGGEEVPNDW